MRVARYVRVVAGASAFAFGCPSAPQVTSSPTVATAPSPTATKPTPYRPEVVYLVMPDRFVDGDPTNNDRGLPHCYEPDNPIKFHGGDLAGLHQRVSYLEELGIDALWLTPLYRQAYGKTDWCPFHGYWADFTVTDDGGLEPRLGTADELTTLIASLRERGVGFIADMVVNHPADHAKIVEQRPQWFADPKTCAAAGNPVVDCPFREGAADFDHRNPEAARYLTELSRGWVKRFDFAGIRMDTAKHVPPEYFRDQWLPAVRGQRAGLFTVAEVFSGDLEELRTYLDAGFDGAINYPLHGALLAAFAHDEGLQPIVDTVQALQRTLGPRRVHDLVNFVDNHDVPRFVSEIPSDVPRDQALARYHLALVALFTLPGIPQLYYGNEVAMLGGRDPDNRRDMPTWAFDAAGRNDAHPQMALGTPAETFERVRELVALRRGSRALQAGDFSVVPTLSTARTLVFARTQGQERVIVVLNNASDPLDVSADTLGGSPQVVFGPGRLESGSLRVPASSAAILTESAFTDTP